VASKEGTQVWEQRCTEPWEEENQRDQGHPLVSPLLQNYPPCLRPVRQPLTDMA